MTHDLNELVLSVALTWVMLMTASILRARAWTPHGFVAFALGNRDNLPTAFPAADRADRAAKNMLENLLLFAVLLLTAHAAGVDPERLTLPARIFFVARVLYFPVYVAGIKYLRTALWGVGIAADVMIALTLLP